MELVQKQIHCSETGKPVLDQFYVDQDFNVPDAKEDVGQIVTTEGYLKVEDCKVVENYLRVTGRVFFRVLYITAQAEPRPAVMEGKIPFEEMVYIEDGKEEYFLINDRIEFTASQIHSRKINVRAMVELEFAKESIKDRPITLDVDSPMGVYKKKRVEALLQLQTMKNDTYRIKEEITLPSSKECVGQMLMCSIEPQQQEILTGQDELRIRGELQVFCLYLSEEQKTDWIEQRVPYDGKVECPGVEPGMFHNIHALLEDPVLDVRMDEDGEMRVLGVEGTLNLRIQIFAEEEMEVLEDVYSLEGECKPETEEGEYEALLIQSQSRCKITEVLSLPELAEDVLQICHSRGDIQLEHTQVQKEGILLEGILNLSFLYIKANDEAPFGCWQGMIPFSYLMESPKMCEDARFHVQHHLEQLTVSLAGNESVEVKAVLGFDAFVRCPVHIPVIQSVALEPFSAEALAARPGIVGYIVKEGDNLWSLAKRYLTTEEMIKSINQLEETPLKCGQKLIIPKDEKLLNFH